MYCIVMFVFYYDMYSFTRAIPPCLVNISYHMSVNRDQLAIIGVLDWYLDFRLHVQSVPITTNPMSLNPVHGKMYSIQLYMIHFFSELRQDDGFLRVLRFLQTIKLTDKIYHKYYWMKRLKILMGSSEVVSQSRMDNAKCVVKDLNPFT